MVSKNAESFAPYLESTGETTFSIWRDIMLAMFLLPTWILKIICMLTIPVVDEHFWNPTLVIAFPVNFLCGRKSFFLLFFLVVLCEIF